jgi:hypothetical protein
MFKNFWNWLFKTDRYILDNLNKIQFKYVPRSTLPDVILVGLNGKTIKSYDWIDGEDAPTWSNLHKIHQEFYKRTALFK